MKRGIQGLVLLAVGVVLGYPLPGHAQALTLADLAGTWQKTLDQKALSAWGSDATPVYASFTVRPEDNVILQTLVLAYHGRYEGDTIACTTKAQIDRLANDTLVWNGNGDRATLKLQNQQLSWVPFGGGPEVYQRVDPSKQPFARVIATGFSGRPLPVHPKTPTGTLADLVGIWKGSPYNWATDDGTRFRIFRPDSTGLDIEIYKSREDKLVCGRTRGWGMYWQRQPGDSIIQLQFPDSNTVSPGWKIVLQNQNQHLSFFGQEIPGSKRSPERTETYEAVSTVQQP